MLSNIETRTAVRACNFSFSGHYIMFTTDKTMGHPCEIYIYDIGNTSKFFEWLNIFYAFIFGLIIVNV